MDYNSFYSQFNNQGDQNSGSSSQPLNQTPAGDDSGQAGNQAPATDTSSPSTSSGSSADASTTPPTDTTPKTDDLPPVELPTTPPPAPASDDQNNIPLVIPTMPVADSSPGSEQVGSVSSADTSTTPATDISSTDISSTPPAPPSAAPIPEPTPSSTPAPETDNVPLPKTENSESASTPSNNDDETSYEDILNKDILELMGAKDLPEEKRQELYQKMLDTIQNRVIARLADMLKDDELEEFKKIADTDDQTKMSDFLKSKNIDLAQLMLQESLIYKTEMVNLAKPLKDNK